MIFLKITKEKKSKEITPKVDRIKLICSKKIRIILCKRNRN